MALTITMAVLTCLLLAATGISFLRIPHGFVRIFSFPRLQLLVLAGVLLVVELVFVEEGLVDSLIVFGLIVVMVAQAVTIAQFTPLRKRQSVRFEGDPDAPNTISLLSYNVKESNTKYQNAIDLAIDHEPDLALYMETHQTWVDALQPLCEHYPHVVSHPLDNAYGMVLFSKLELSEIDVRYLVLEEIPSIIATVKLRDGQLFRLYCVHPEPPVPHIDSVGRDAELLKVAEMVTTDKRPAIVTGDLNDVAWSNTTRMFQRLSRLLDPRVGRGFYNTFDARFPFLRWPLDHLFHDARFQLVSMKRLPNAGSDHFPMYFKLALAGLDEDVEMPEQADADDHAEAAEIKQEGRELDRDPIGADWEKSS